MPDRWSHEELVDALHRAAQAAAEQPLTIANYEWHRDDDDPAYTDLAYGLGDGSWSRAVTAAGLNPHRRPNRSWTSAEILDAVATWWATTDDHRLPAYRDAARLDPTLPSEQVILLHAGGWKAIKAALAARSTAP